MTDSDYYNFDMERTQPRDPRHRPPTQPRPIGARMPDESATLAVVVARLDDVKEELRAMREDARKDRENTVGRGEWEQRNNHVTARLEGLGREIGELRTNVASARTEIENRRAPWWSVVAALGSVVAVAAVLIPALAK